MPRSNWLNFYRKIWSKKRKENWNGGNILRYEVPYDRKLTLHEIKVSEINANLMENDFRIKKSIGKEEVEFHNKGN